MTTSLLDQIKSGLENLQLSLPQTKPEQKRLQDYLRIEFIYSQLTLSNQNPLNRSQIIKLVDSQMKLNDVNLIIQQEAINLNNCYNLIYRLADQNKKISENSLFKLKTTLSEGIVKDNQSNYRQTDRQVKNSNKHFPSPNNISRLIKGYLKWLNGLKIDPYKTPKQALNCYYGLTYIHPFKDSNQKLAGLVTSYLLIKNGYPPLLIREGEKQNYEKKISIALKQANIKPLRTQIFKSINYSVENTGGYLGKNKERETYPLAKPTKDLLKIGQVANQTNETVPTIRHWTQENLLKPVAKTKGGFMLYSKESIKKARRIRELQKERLTLEEISKVFYKED